MFTSGLQPESDRVISAAGLEGNAAAHSRADRQVAHAHRAHDVDGRNAAGAPVALQRVSVYNIVLNRREQ